MGKKPSYHIRKMTREEVERIAIEWAANEGWNPGFFDAGCFFKTDPGGFLVGFLDEEPISCISIVSYDSDFAFLGFYMVRPKYRGKGYGIKIWNAALELVNDRNIGLDGVIDQQPNYRKSGFKLAYSNIRYEGLAKSTSYPLPSVVQLSQVSFESVLNYDRALFPASRAEFLKCWIDQPESLALAALEENQLAGYSVIRKCREGYKIGPLMANNSKLANQLFLASFRFPKEGSKIYLDTPEINSEAVKMAEHYSMKKVFGTARMYNKHQPSVDINRVFGVTTFELG